jgi:uncharacterized protein YlxW (UPF0749 family)
MVEPRVPPRRPDGSMSLLVDMSAAALDPSYAEVAARRERYGPAGTARRRRGTVHVRALVALVAAGLATGVALAQVRRDAEVADELRRSLVTEVQHRTDATDALAERAATLRAEVSDVRASALGAGAAGQALAQEVALLELVTGTVPVRGPGIVVVLDDAPADDGAEPGDGRVFDRDLQDVVNALWAAGAEAVAVNGQRLTSRTAIRSAGDAVLVDLRPLSPPYRLEAVGDVEAMEPAFVDSPTARRFQTWTSLYGLGFEVRRADALRLPAAPEPVTRTARPLAVPGGGT